MKRIIVCCDDTGTWLVSHNPNPSNVALISRAVRPYSTSNPEVPQLVYYQKGVGTNPCTVQRLIGGGFGEGINDNIGCAYIYIALNYCPGDEIYLFGFSRGAYTARAIAGLICQYGIMTKRGLEGFGVVYREYMKKRLSPDLVEKLAEKYERIPNIPIKFIGVWDTVGSLGVPEFYICGWRPSALNWFLHRFHKPYQLHATDLYPNIKHACHALALNEKRAPFTPTLWHVPPDNTETVLKQVWFPGVHSSVGGGDPDYGLSNIALAWMIQQIHKYTDLELDDQYLLTVRSAFGVDPTLTPWGNGPWLESFAGAFKIWGWKKRTPGKYIPETDGRTYEYIHKSVVERMNGQGKKFVTPDLKELTVDEFGDVEMKFSWLAHVKEYTESA